VYSGLVHNPLFFIILLSGTWTTGSRLYSHYRYGKMDTDKPYGYYDIPSAQRLKISAYYFGLIALLVFAMYQNNKFKKSPRQLKGESEVIVYDYFVGDDGIAKSNHSELGSGYGVWQSPKQREEFYETTVVHEHYDIDDDDDDL
jgi:hypothetical protein